jgi:hypothetical protein
MAQIAKWRKRAEYRRDKRERAGELCEEIGGDAGPHPAETPFDGEEGQSGATSWTAWRF